MKKIILLFLVISIAVSAFSGCVAVNQVPTSGTEAYPSASASIQEPSDTDHTEIIESEFPTYADVEALAADSVLVVTGQYGDEDPDVVNTAKDAENPLVESRDVYAECHVFTFHVQEVLKGNCSVDEIRVGLSYGIRPAGSSELAVKDTYLEPTTDDHKILFLLYSESDGFYYPTSQPYQLCFAQTADLSGTNGSSTFELDTAIDGLSETFVVKADSISELRELIG